MPNDSAKIAALQPFARFSLGRARNRVVGQFELEDFAER
jgi:hypothetical protein